MGLFAAYNAANNLTGCRCRSSGCWLAEPPEDVGDPHRGVVEIFEDLPFVGGGEAAAKDGQHPIVNLALTQMAQSLDHEAADSTGGDQVARRAAFENDREFAQMNPARRTVG